MNSLDVVLTEAEATLEWEGSPALRAEFLSQRDYIAFRKAEARGLVRIHSSPGLVRGSREMAKAPQRFTLDAPVAHGATVKVTLSGAGRGRIAGYGAVFGTVNRRACKIEPGAFRASLRTPLPMLWLHDHDKPIGHWDVLREDNFGLWAEGQINLAVPAGREAFELVEGLDVTGLSVGFGAEPGGYEYEQASGIVIYKAVDLMEVSVCPVPAEKGARVVKSGEH